MTLATPKPQRGFYGGKTAMRVPPLVAGYCAVICSGDFNDWIWKTASTRDPEHNGVGRFSRIDRFS